MKKVAAVLGAFAVSALVLVTHPGVADAQSTGNGLHPMIEVGGGSEADSGGVNVLLHVGVGVKKTLGSQGTQEVPGPEQLIWAHISGDFAVLPSGDGHVLPYVDIQLAALEDHTSVHSDAGNRTTGVLSVLPGAITRNVALDESVTVHVSVVKVEFDLERVQTQHVSIYAQAVADAVGYKMASHISDMGTFNGFRVAGAGAEGGILFNLGRDTSIRIVLGGSADLNIGGDRGAGFSIQSDMQAYLAVRANITKLFQLFVQASLNGAWDSGNSSFASTPEIMVGATFIF